MWGLRLLAVATTLGVLVSAAAALLTGNAAYMRFAWRLFRYGLLVALLMLSLLILERVAAMVL